MSLLTIVQGACRRVHYPQPIVALASTDPNILLMVDCVQDTGDELMERWGWQALKLQSPAQFTGDGVTPTFTLPANMSTLEPDDVFVSSMYPMMRLTMINEDDLVRAKAIPMSVYPSNWRVVDNSIEFYPVLQPGEIVTYIYQGKYWIISGGKQAETFSSDADTVAISERLIRLGAIWRWRKAKGLSYDEEMRDYELTFERLAGQESTEREVIMSRMNIGGTDENSFVGVVPTGGDFNADFGSDFSTGAST